MSFWSDLLYAGGEMSPVLALARGDGEQFGNTLKRNAQIVGTVLGATSGGGVNPAQVGQMAGQLGNMFGGNKNVSAQIAPQQQNASIPSSPIAGLNQRQPRQYNGFGETLYPSGGWGYDQGSSGTRGTPGYQEWNNVITPWGAVPRAQQHGMRGMM